jgi:hypothetical protein
MKYIVVVHQHETRMMVVDGESEMDVIDRLAAGAYETAIPKDVSVQTWAHITAAPPGIVADDRTFSKHSGMA